MFVIFFILRWCALHEHSPDPSTGDSAAPLLAVSARNNNPTPLCGRSSAQVPGTWSALIEGLYIVRAFHVKP
jgi:hypothetical protein